MAVNITEPVHDRHSRADPLKTLRRMGVRICWVPDLGRPAAYVPDLRVMLLEARLSRAEACAFVRRWIQDLYAED